MARCAKSASRPAAASSGNSSRGFRRPGTARYRSTVVDPGGGTKPRLTATPSSPPHIASTSQARSGCIPRVAENEVSPTGKRLRPRG